MDIYTDFPERLSPKRMVFVGAQRVPLTIRSNRSHGQGLLLAFDGFDTPEAVGRFRNQLLYIASAEALELDEVGNLRFNFHLPAHVVFATKKIFLLQ